MNLIANFSRPSRNSFFIVVGLVLLAIGGCAEQGGEAPSAQVDSDVAEGSVLILSWTELSADMFNTIIYVRLQAVTDGYKIGPYEAFVRADGSARVGIGEAYDASEEWTVSYWIDGNDNQTCDEGSADILRQRVLPIGADSAILSQASDAAPNDLCAFPGPLSGFSNYEPRN